jgi:hypothetical protein
MSSLQILTEFKKNLVQFLDELIDQFPEEGDFVIFRVFVNDQLPTQEIMNHFITSILPHKAIIKARDDKVFTEMNILYFGMDKSKAGVMRKIWRSPRLDVQDREVIWRWFDSFIYLVEKYQKVMENERR